MSTLFPNELRIVCTGRGEHTSIELALMQAEKQAPPGFRGWQRPEDVVGRNQGEGGRLPGEPERFGEFAGRFRVAQGDRTRRTRAGVEKPNESKGEVVKHERADGGETFEFPACPKCSPGRPRLIRDDSLARFIRGLPGQPLDISLIP